MAFFRLLKHTVISFYEDDVLNLSASLAFYTLLSLSPILIILLSFAGFIGRETQNKVVMQIEGVAGGHAGEMVGTVIQNAYENQFVGKLSAIAGIVVVFFAATSVFVNLQKAMNKIWNVKEVKGTTLTNFLRKRLISIIMVMSIGLILFVSLIINTLLAHIFPQHNMIWNYVNEAFSVGMYTFVFSLLIKYIPDIYIRWRDVLVGAVLTALLFKGGELVFSRYITQLGMGSSFGAAGSLVLFLFWVYYSSIIIFFGTEYTQVYTKEFGSKLHPTDRAEWTS